MIKRAFVIVVMASILIPCTSFAQEYLSGSFLDQKGNATEISRGPMGPGLQTCKFRIIHPHATQTATA
jgi:hypothetical protein